MGLPDFKALKERVGIDDVAYYLGYQVNRQAGVGRFIEMVLPDGNGGHSDSIVIREPHDKANQFYFRHKGFGKGDVIAFIQENINRFNETGRNQWEIVGKVLMRLANEPMPEINVDSYLGRVSYPGRQSFEPERWETQPMSDHVRNALQFMAPRGFNQFTAETFAPYIVRIRDTQSESYKEFNIGFPYRVPGNDEVVGYEIRGFGQYKLRFVASDSISRKPRAPTPPRRPGLSTCLPSRTRKLSGTSISPKAPTTSWHSTRSTTRNSTRSGRCSSPSEARSPTNR